MELTRSEKFPMHPVMIVALRYAALKRVMEFQRQHNAGHPQKAWNAVLSVEEMNMLHSRSNANNGMIILPQTIFSEEAKLFLSGMEAQTAPGICVDLSGFLPLKNKTADIIGALFNNLCWTRHPDNRLYVATGKLETQFLMALQPRKAPKAPRYRGPLTSTQALPAGE